LGNDDAPVGWERIWEINVARSARFRALLWKSCRVMLEPARLLSRAMEVSVMATLSELREWEREAQGLLAR
jgi:hypothetical protein